MFRISSLAGTIVDAILAERGSKNIDEMYYSQVSTSIEQGIFSLKNDELGHSLKLTYNDIVFVKNVYANERAIDFEKSIDEFTFLWRLINNSLKLTDVRRIGILAEHQFRLGASNVNKKLIETLTKFRIPDHPAKFRLGFETRYPTLESLAPDLKKDDFINIIYEYYDAELDSEHPTPDMINANLDVQKYYAPLIKGSSVPDETKKLFRKFIEEKEKLEKLLTEKGVLG